LLGRELLRAPTFHEKVGRLCCRLWEKFLNVTCRTGVMSIYFNLWRL